jgi:hypothetical protein
LDFALSIKDTLGIEFGHALNGSRIATRVEVDDFLIGVLEGEDDGIGGKGCK